MKYSSILTITSLLLASCGGGGSSTATNNTNANTTPSLKAFAESWVAMYASTALSELLDLQLTVNTQTTQSSPNPSLQCANTNGTVSGNYYSNTETFTNCQGHQPSTFLYTGVITGKSGTNNSVIPPQSPMRLALTSNNQQLFTINSADFNGSKNSGQGFTILLNSGIANITAGSASTYNITQINSSVSFLNNTEALNTGFNLSVTKDYNAHSPTVTSTVQLDYFQDIQSGSLSIVSTLGCSPMNVVMTATQFTLSCPSGGNTVTYDWTDPVVIQALRNAIQ
jgi:hypothetical protein